MDPKVHNKVTSMTQKSKKCCDSDPCPISDPCPVCGVDRAPRKIELLGSVFEMPVKCKCQIAEYEKEMERIRSYERRERWRKVLKNSGVSGSLGMKTIDSFILRPGTEMALQAAREFISKIHDKIETGEGIMFLGRPGNGKTFLAAAIVNAALEQGISASLQNVPSLLARIKATYGKGNGETEYEFIDYLERVEILVLDDLGKERSTDWAHEKLYTVINSRYAQNRVIIITSNYEINELVERLGDGGEAVVDRLMERCRLAINKGTSYRREMAMARLQEDLKTLAAGG